jgi:hypothetical protein
MKNDHKRQKHNKQTKTSKVAAATAACKRKIEDRLGKELAHKRPKHCKTPAAIRDEEWDSMEDVAPSDTEVVDLTSPSPKVKVEDNATPDDTKVNITLTLTIFRVRVVEIILATVARHLQLLLEAHEKIMA